MAAKVERGDICKQCSPTEEQCEIYQNDVGMCPNPTKQMNVVEDMDKKDGVPK